MTDYPFLASKLLNPYDLPKKDEPYKLMIMGTPGTGKSISEELAKNNPNVIYIDLSEQEKIAHEEEQKLAKEADEKRLLAVKEAYWLHSQDDEGTLDFLKFLLIETYTFTENEPPSQDDLKALFFFFDDYLIGQIISWGIDDTEVRESIYAYIEEEKTQLDQVLFLTE